MRYFVKNDFLSSDECDQIIDLAKNRLTQAGGFDVSIGQTTISDYRRTDITFFQKQENPFIASIEKRIAELVKMPEENGEGLQYGKYMKGFYYKEHYDFADKKWAGGVGNFLNRGGQRAVTCLIYLNTLPEGVGGETFFMDHDPQLKFRPIQGRALVFYNVNTDIDQDGKPVFSEECAYDTKHEACPITGEDTVKHIVTKWYREHEFR